MLTPYEFLTAHPGLRGATLDCDNLSIVANGHTARIDAGTRIVITPCPGKFRIDCVPEPQLDLGWGVHAPIRFEVTPDGQFAIGRALGITQRKRLVFSMAEANE